MKKYDKKDITREIKKNFLENFRIKVICFFLAIAVYVAFGFFQLNEKSFNCRLNITGLSDNYIITGDIPSTVKVIVKDKQKVLNNLSENDFKVQLDLKEMKTLTADILLKRELPLSIDSLFSSVKLVPDRISVSLDKLEEKTVPVVVVHIGDPKFGYAITNIVVEPSELKIKATKKNLDKIKYVETERIDIKEIDSILKKEVNLITPDNSRIIGRTKAEVTINVEKNDN